MIKIGATYRHYKGRDYRVIALAKHSETLDDMVVYKALYAGDFPYGQVWVRPAKMWNEMVGDVPRFLLVDPHPLISKMPREVALPINGVVMRAVTPTDVLARELFDVINASREHIKPYRRIGLHPKTIDDFFGVLKKSEDKWNTGNNFEYWIFLDGKLAGNINMLRFDLEHKVAEIGYWLADFATGRGIITTAIAALEKIAFNDLGLRRLVIRCELENQNSARVAERAGFKFEGIVRSGMFSEYKNNFADLKQYSKLSTD